MKIRFFCFVYGDTFLDMFRKIAVRSLLQGRNRAAIPHDATVALYSDSPSMEWAMHYARLIGKVEAHFIIPTENVAEAQNQAFIDEVERCHKANATMIIVGPENFWGDGSLGNLLEIAGRQNVCVAAPHVRVDRDKFISLLPDREIDNPSLVKLSMGALHPSWVHADSNLEQTSSFHAGISIHQISDGLYTVTHRLPTCWLARFTQEDVNFFNRNTQGRGLWDHIWPQMLIRAERQRVIGSSDAFFIAELTDAGTHNVSLTQANPSEPDAYCTPSLHASVNRNLVAVWRGFDNP